MELPSAEEATWDENAPKEHQPPSPAQYPARRIVLRTQFANGFKKTSTISPCALDLKLNGISGSNEMYSILQKKAKAFVNLFFFFTILAFFS
jgi:hypothetical protein